MRTANENQHQARVCIVTGAASGIGTEVALVYARNGGKVVIADEEMDAAQTVADEIRKAGGTAMAVTMDVTGDGQFIIPVADVAATYGSVDILVSNAGIQIVRPTEGFPFCEWKEVASLI